MGEQGSDFPKKGVSQRVCLSCRYFDLSIMVVMNVYYCTEVFLKI